MAIAGYLAAWPVPIEPVAWQPALSPGYTGVHSVNSRLADLQRIELGGAAGPEHVALGPDGKLYVAVEAGRVLRMAPDGSDREVFVETGGRVLGFDFDAAGTLYAADAIRGLLSIDRSGKLRVLADTMAGEPIRYADAVAVAMDGKIYFTDASRRFAPRDWGGTFEASVLDILENSATGRVLVYDPAVAASGGAAVQVVAGGLSFANGIVLTRDGQSLLVNETGRYRVWRIDPSARGLDLSQPAPGALAQVLLDDLPGYPDNLMHGLDGRIWLGFAKPRSAVIDRLAAWVVAGTEVLRSCHRLHRRRPDRRRSAGPVGRLPGDDGDHRDARASLCAEPARRVARLVAALAGGRHTAVTRPKACIRAARLRHPAGCWVRGFSVRVRRAASTCTSPA